MSRTLAMGGVLLALVMGTTALARSATAPTPPRTPARPVRTLPGPAPGPTLPAPSLDAFVGPWKVTFTIEQSTCAGTAAGASQTARWTISAGKKAGQLALAERDGHKGDPRAWTGQVATSGGGLTITAGRLAAMDATLRAGMPLAQLVGKRVVVRGGSCVVVERFVAERPDDEPVDVGTMDPDANFGLDAALAGLPPGEAVIATIDTDVGKLTCELFPGEAPHAVANFIGLARGRRAWRDPATGHFFRGRPFYDGLAFHRVIAGFMIQGGDPASRDWDIGQMGAGGAGYTIVDDPARRPFDVGGRLAVANRGPGTASSQFFITEVAAPHLNGTAVVFGACGPKAVVMRASHVPVDPRSGRPDLPLVIKKVTISRGAAPVLE
jgi:peptidyl-prolyl cis-trans isomerase A (cyclophilin A)